MIEFQYKYAAAKVITIKLLSRRHESSVSNTTLTRLTYRAYSRCLSYMHMCAKYLIVTICWIISLKPACELSGIRLSCILCSLRNPHRRHLVHHDHHCGRCVEVGHCTGCCCTRCHVRCRRCRHCRRYHRYVQVFRRQGGRNVRRGVSYCCQLAEVDRCGTLGLERGYSSTQGAARPGAGRRSLLHLAIHLLVEEEPSLGAEAECRSEGVAARSWRLGRKEVEGRQGRRNPESCCYCSHHHSCCCCCCCCSRLVHRRCCSHLRRHGHHHSLHDRLHVHGIHRGRHGPGCDVMPQPRLR
jgi:hypothetical protein